MGVDGLAETPDSAMPVLPGKEYYHASKLGEGSYGSVVTVYDDDGCEYAAKMFDSDDFRKTKQTIRRRIGRQPRAAA
eukprot:scaffold3118_cov128-Isochrysis_galbana.AAC.3